MLLRYGLASALALSLIGCVSQSSLDGFRVPEAHRGEKTYFVENHGNDSRNLDDQIAAALRKHGFIATSQRPEEFDYRVTYEDQWYWDMRMYLIDLRIDVRDADTNVLVASARSYQTSLAAMGKTHASVIDAAVEVLAVGVAESPPPRRDGSRRGRRRR